MSRLRLLKKHCESEEKFGVKLNDFTCATLKCRETHMSYIECMSERRRCVIPDVVESRSEDVYVSLAGSNSLFLRTTLVMKEK